MRDNRQTEQARRVLIIYNELLKGKTLNSKDIHEKMCEEVNPEISLRTVQRDLKLLGENIQMCEETRDGKQKLWKLSKNFYKPLSVMKVESNELLSYYILKAHLKTFEGTSIEKHAKSFAKKLEEFAPGEAYLYESLFWDQNRGMYDYKEHENTLNKIIDAITERKTMHITYHSAGKGTEKTYDVLFMSLFAYNGSLYVVTYFDQYKSFEALQLQGIKDIEDSIVSIEDYPYFDFNEFTTLRYGVFTGELYNIKLRVKKDFIGYFVNRKWHESQQEYNDRDGNLIIEMRVPLGMDLVSWILSWHDAIKVLEPLQLKEKVQMNLMAALAQYQNEGFKK